MIDKDYLADWNPEKDYYLHNPCGSHLQLRDSLSQLKIQNPGEQFDWSIDRVAVGKRVM